MGEHPSLRTSQRMSSLKLILTGLTLPLTQLITNPLNPNCLLPVAILHYITSVSTLFPGAGGWSPLESDKHQWLQIDLRERMEVSGIAVQGRHGSSDWVTSFLLMFSDTDSGWKQYQQDDSLWDLPGNSDADGVVHYKFPQSIKTRFLKFIPLEWSPGGGIGMRVEVYGCTYKSDVADFDGRSSLLYRFNQKSMSTVKDVISLKFKSKHSEGVLVHGEGQRGDYITLELHRGTLALHINLDDAKLQSSASHLSVTLGSLLDDQHWHSVLIERFNKQINFTVDKHTQHFRTKGSCDSLEIDYELSFGGIPLPGKPGTFLRKNFHGCIENLYYNGVNIIDLAKRRKPQIYTGNVTFSCSNPRITPVTFLSHASSYLLLPSESLPEGLTVRFQFRTWNRDGLLLHTHVLPKSESLLLYLSSGRLKLTHQKSVLDKMEITTGHGLGDGLWHTVSLSTRGFQVSVRLDNDMPNVLESNSVIGSGDSFFFGGCPATLNDLNCRSPTLAFQGCMRLIFINNQPINFFQVQQGLLGNFSDIQIDVCGIRDRCLPNYCEHGGQCSQSWSTFHCDCSGTGYTGATCHNSIYEPSCEAYRHTGSTSGYFSIDSDGSGPLGPTLVYCNITEDKIWTVMNHHNMAFTRVQGSNPERPYTMQFNYSTSREQLQAVVSAAEHCEQEIMYRCWKSRLLNTQDGSPFSWWIGRTSEKQTYWSGSSPGILQCECGLEENCMDMNYFCNCDADREEWATDAGLLTYKEHLPVSQIVIGDTDRPDSEAFYRVGPLKCYGDRNFWNSASFNKEASYLNFPTFHAELSADISFYFKTTSDSGIFLENLGTKDFIRIELSSPVEVTFSFDVGNGAVQLTVKSPNPLNDKQWHYVKAERNTKEASLQVDQLPIKFKEAPADGHLRLQLTSQLFVGGTISRQKGFLGCIRSLMLNGLTLNLEERAKMTPGVRPGCPGHCSSYSSFCQNGGKCTEKYNGYSCDCTYSAYVGPFCKKEVSALFEADSSVTLTFQEPSLDKWNKSTQSSLIFSETSKSRESISFSFLTARTPAMLFFLNTYHQEYMAVILSRNGSLQIWYRLNKLKEPDVFFTNTVNLANAQVHQVRINREGRDIYVQIDQNVNTRYTLSSDSELTAINSLTLGKTTGSPSMDREVMFAGMQGFIGCLSSVQFNQIAPLKAALHQQAGALVTVKGHLLESNCGSSIPADLNTFTTTHSLSDHSEKADNEREPLMNAIQSDSAVIGGVIAVVIFITFCIIAVMTRFLHLQRNMHQAVSKDKEHREGLERALRNDVDLQSTVGCNKKEYFI
uniref:Contactin-associated protein-like 5 n=1 Tax=Erpetoichthys calabaricus TaxID=27687 RepID=A0A8C4T9N3_ERPCA